MLKVENLSKSIGIKELFEDLNFEIKESEKIALIGRNGLGKSTLFKILTGEDTDYTGQITIKKGVKLIMTQQEYFLDDETTPIEYILASVPKFILLKSIITKFEEIPSSDMEEIENYTNAINEFAHLGYYDIEQEILEFLERFEVTIDMAFDSMKKLSGGEKRFIEIARVVFSKADLALIDEPTNHMDYVGKEKFINWLNETKQTLILISHDRDVLKQVDKIFELKNKQISVYNGNYDDYLKKNSNTTAGEIKGYELDLNKIDKARKQMNEAKKNKLRARSTKSRTAAKIREYRFKKELENLQDNLNKPSIWIDQESIKSVDKTVVEKYEKYKDKNINIRSNVELGHKKKLLKVHRLSLGYSYPLFENIEFEIFNQDRIFVRGRNGAGKSTLIKAIIHSIQEKELLSQKYKGEIIFPQNLKIGVYEQEVNPNYLEMTLAEAVYHAYKEKNITINRQGINNILGSYLFDPSVDADLRFKNLSGGQKARFQIIKMLSNDPQILILDEPTNHLDLPSIEELEKALLNYHGAIIYITHDNYFVEKLGGHIIDI